MHKNNLKFSKVPVQVRMIAIWHISLMVILPVFMGNVTINIWEFGYLAKFMHPFFAVLCYSPEIISMKFVPCAVIFVACRRYYLKDYVVRKTVFMLLFSVFGIIALITNPVFYLSVSLPLSLTLIALIYCYQKWTYRHKFYLLFGVLLFLSLYVFGYLLPLLLLHPNYTAYVDQSNDSQSAVDKIFYIHSPDEGGSLSNPPGKGEPINSLMDGIFGRERIDKVRIENPERTYNGDAARLRAGDLAKGLRLHLDQKKNGWTICGYNSASVHRPTELRSGSWWKSPN